MADLRNFLFELGTEELPPKALARLGQSLFDGVTDGLGQAGLAFNSEGSRWFASPRRLAVLVSDLSTKQPDRSDQRLGPAVAAAFDDAGEPTRAAEGFASSCGVSVDELQRVETEKGERLAYQVEKPGQSAAELLPGILTGALDRLPIPKRMRWGEGEAQFVRPVHWLVMLLGNEVVPGEIMGVTSSNQSRGHRFHHPDPVTIKRPEDYVECMRAAFVIADFEERRDKVLKGVEAACGAIEVEAVLDSDLVNEVAALVEWPVALAGSFDTEFLGLPAEVLISTMQGHQKYFPCRAEEGLLTSHFVGVANLESTDPAQVVAGYERVIRPRLADAQFFWEQDLKVPLADYQPELKKMVFEKRLGTLWDKVERIISQLKAIGNSLDQPVDDAIAAAKLCKCDLLSQLVGEFPELQGCMGRHYAQHQGTAEEVALAIEEHYQPRFAGDAIPVSRSGRLLALADRLDTLAGVFAVGMKPSGTKDPYGLRRAALGVVRLIIEGDMELNLRELIDSAVAVVLEHDKGLAGEGDAIFDYVLERARGYFAERGIRGDVFDAVVATGVDGNLLDFTARAEALSGFRARSEAASLAAANKRIRNILRKTEVEPADKVNRDLLQEKAENSLYDWLSAARRALGKALESRDYAEGLNQLASLRDPVDHFFDEVLVMAEDEALRDNRIALLSAVRESFLEIADISYLQLESEDD